MTQADFCPSILPWYKAKIQSHDIDHRATFDRTKRQRSALNGSEFVYQNHSCVVSERNQNRVFLALLDGEKSRKSKNQPRDSICQDTEPTMQLKKLGLQRDRSASALLRNATKSLSSLLPPTSREFEEWQGTKDATSATGRPQPSQKAKHAEHVARTPNG